jgi:DNA-binding SARP family transcriptional activator
MFHMLGTLIIQAPGGVIALPAAKLRTVLAVLLLRRGQMVTTDRLIAELWGDLPPRTSKASLQTYVYRLRRALLPLGECGVELVTVGSGYVLITPEEAVDVLVFERMVSQGASALLAGEPEVAAERLRDALARWRGPLLPDVQSEFVAAERHRLEEIRVMAQEQCFTAEMELGLHVQILPELQALVRAWPLRERLWAMLMQALADCGRRAEALAAFREVRNVLNTELGIEPGRDLQLLHQDILRGPLDRADRADRALPTARL